MRIPINCNDMLTDILKMKRDLEDLTHRVRNYLQGTEAQFIAYESPFISNLVYKYQKIGMKC